MAEADLNRRAPISFLSAIMIGIDFDNTVICYDSLFFAVANDLRMVDQGIAKTKDAVRHHIQAKLSNEAWTVLQGEVYGARILEARPYPGVVEFLTRCRERGLRAGIISHKSRYPAMGKPYDLHRSALAWLEANGLFAVRGPGLSSDQVVFAETREAKIEYIHKYNCTHFIDDLPEVFAESGFPPRTEKLLFDPHDSCLSWSGGFRARSWEEIRKRLLEDGALGAEPNSGLDARSSR